MDAKEIFGIGRRFSSPYISDNWVEFDPNYTILSTPTLLTVGGNDTKKPIQANGYCKTMEILFPRLNYGELKQMGIYYKTLEYPDKVIGKLMADTIFGPLYSDKTGNLLPLKTIKLNFSNINIFAHCRGSAIVTEMGRSLNESLIAAGLTEQQAHSATQEVFVLHYAPMLDDIKDNVFTNAHFFSGNDQLIISDTMFKRYLINPDKCLDFAGCGQIYEKFGNTFFYTDGISPDDSQDDHQMPTLRDNIGYYRCDAMLTCMHRLLKEYTNRSLISHRLGEPIDVDKEDLIDELREGVEYFENAHKQEEEIFKQENHHPEHLKSYFASVERYYRNKELYGDQSENSLPTTIDITQDQE